MIKSPREMAESLYDGTAANGSFLDNLIRSSLESGIPRERAIAEARSNAAQQQPPPQQHPENLGNSKVLIDQLCRNSRRTPLPRAGQQDSSEDESPGYRPVSQQRSLPERPERVPTVDLSPSPSERARATDEGSDRGLASPPTPLSLSRLSGSGREDETTRDSRSSREREVRPQQHRAAYPPKPRPGRMAHFLPRADPRLFFSDSYEWLAAAAALHSFHPP
jgi:hypothetical protein